MGKIKVKYLWIGIAILFVVGCALVFGVTQTEGFWTDVVIVLIAADFIIMTIAIQVATSRTFKFKAKPIDYDKKEYEFSKGIEVTLKKLGYRQKEAVYGHNYLKFSDHIFKALRELIDFNYQNIYMKANSSESLTYYKNVFNRLFNVYYQDILNNNKNSSIYKYFLLEMSDDYLKNTSDKRKVIDYLSLMTDEFLIKEYERIK